MTIEAVRGEDLIAPGGINLRLAWLDITPAQVAAAHAVLAPLVGSTVLVLGLGADDRWGRRPALVAPLGADGAPGPLLQTTLAERGLGRLRADAAPRPSTACMSLITAGERSARTGRTGLWAAPASRVVPAHERAALLALAGTYAVVEGRPTSVRERTSVTYINFGSAAAQDLSVTVPKRIWRNLVGRGMSAAALQQALIRVRGDVEDRGGRPLIELASPDEIELAGTESTR